MMLRMMTIVVRMEVKTVNRLCMKADNNASILALGVRFQMLAKPIWWTVISNVFHIQNNCMISTAINAVVLSALALFVFILLPFCKIQLVLIYASSSFVNISGIFFLRLIYPHTVMANPITMRKMAKGSDFICVGTRLDTK